MDAVQEKHTVILPICYAFLVQRPSFSLSVNYNVNNERVPAAYDSVTSTSNRAKIDSGSFSFTIAAHSAPNGGYINQLQRQFCTQ